MWVCGWAGDVGGWVCGLEEVGLWVGECEADVGVKETWVGAVLTLPLIIIADCGALSGEAGSGGGGSGGGGEDHNTPPAATDPHTNGAGVGAGGGP
ncbi:hypothetical protein Pcinc_009589 [Petrolisthes cinctipes]|uniref:Uncharacterized protein n=1 Tax=Petrolisthes cinctipes TaxID=88211 RepID=A0AAE1G6K0_PETCI|nr:hypothetical protein Pcinc_009589 [Petrolisthes cinctipes]